jgi:hypothetical protein
MALARYQFTVVDDQGNVLPNASVEVRREAIGLPIASLYEDRDGVTPLGNPFNAGADGFAAFHVSGGAYRITATYTGGSRTWRYVAIGTLAEQDSDAPSFGSLSVENIQQTGYHDLAEIAAPSSPAANVARLYARDINGRTELAFRNSAGSDTDLLRNIVLVEDFGAAGDAGAGGNSGTDDTAAFQAAIDYLSNLGGGIVKFGRKSYLIDGTLTIKKNVTLRGPVEMPGQVLPVATASYDDIGGVLYLDSAETISMQWSAGLQNGYIIRKGLVTPFADQTAATNGVAAFAGTAVTITNHDCRLSNLLILGFAQAVNSGGASLPARGRFDYVAFDCTAGILIDGCADVAHLNFCHGFPYLTTGRGFTDATLTRSGIAFAFHTQADWCKMTNCFSFGFAFGFDLDSIGIGTIVGCGADYPGALTSTSIGFRVRGTTPRQANFVMCVAGAQGTGWSIDNGLSSADGGAVSLTNCRGFANDGVHVDVISGRLITTGCVFRNGTIGIQAASTAGALTIAGCEFESLTTPLSIHATPKAISQIYGNRTRNCTNPIDEFATFASSTTATGALKAINTSDNASVQVVRFDGDRATPANNDVAYSSFFLSDAAGNQTEVLRQSWRISDTTDGSEDANTFWSLIINGSLTGRLLLTGTALSPTGDDGIALGASSLQWSDLFLAAGGEVRVNNVRVLTTQGAAIADVATGGSATAAANATAINTILARMRAHGLIAT